MAIRLPLKVIAEFSDDNDTGTGSVAGIIPHTFKIPQDTDNVVLKFTASCVGAGLSAVLQTTDDGGTTYYDMARTSIVSNAINSNAQWLSVPVNGGGVTTAATYATGSILSMGIGNAAASSLGQRAVSGLPVLSTQMRAGVIITGNVTSAASNSCDIKIMTNSQSATA